MRITIGLMRDLEKQVMKEEISYSRMVEILNETASQAAAQFKYDYSKNCECTDRIGETWCCNQCGLPTSKHTDAETIAFLRSELAESEEQIKVLELQHEEVCDERNKLDKELAKQKADVDTLIKIIKKASNHIERSCHLYDVPQNQIDYIMKPYHEVVQKYESTNHHSPGNPG